GAGLAPAGPPRARAVGCGLSVSASAGILLLATRRRAAIPGPPTVREALAVTLAAQAGALPLLVGTFGEVPVATVPANLLAAPAAGPLMVWGLGAGLVAGVVPAPLAGLLHVPTSVLAWWLARVAAWGAGLPLGSVDGTLAALLAGGGALAWAAGRRSPRRRRLALSAVLAVSAA